VEIWTGLEPAPTSVQHPWLDQAVEQARSLGIPIQVVVRQARSIAGAIREAVRAVRADLLVLGWRGGGWPGGILSPLLSDPPCDLAVMRLGVDMGAFQHLLVPTAGGPNAVLAAEIAHAVAVQNEGQATVLYVLRPDAGVAQQQAAQGAIQSTLGQLAEAPEFIAKIVESASPTTGILDEASQGYDTILIGASREGVINRVLFGEIPRKVALQSPIPVIIVKRSPDLAMGVARRAWDRVYAVFPTLTEAEKIEVYKEVRRGARANVDFFVMIGLAAAIAALGLLLNSPAIIIGAMLVAPLMLAIIGLGLGVTLGDLRLLQLATITTLRGMALTMGIGALAGLLIPSTGLTAEVLARARPTLLDLGVALASGGAGAYALCRKDVSAALPGVAIAAALVPPLTSAGIGLALGDGGVAGGALLLFLTNLVAIAAAGGTVFLLLGFQPESEKRERVRMFGRGMMGMLILLLAISLPLGILTQRSLTQARLIHSVQLVMTTEVNAMSGITLDQVQIETTDDQGVLHLSVTLRTTRSVQQDELEGLQARVATRLQRPVALELTIIPTIRLEPFPQPTHVPAAAPSPTPTVLAP